MSDRRMPLTLLVILVTGLVTVLSMVVFAIIQINIQDRKATNILVEHGWHVLVFGAITFPMLYLVLHLNVVKPINALYLRFYAVTQGNLARIDLKSGVLEIQEIIDGINMILTRITSSEVGADFVRLAQDSLENIHSLSNTRDDHLTPELHGRLMLLGAALKELIVAGEKMALQAKDNKQ